MKDFPHGNAKLSTALQSQKLQDHRHTQPTFSVRDLKALACAQRYVAETIQWLPQKPESVLLVHIFTQVAALGQIHLTQPTHPNPALA